MKSRLGHLGRLAGFPVRQVTQFHACSRCGLSSQLRYGLSVTRRSSRALLRANRARILNSRDLSKRNPPLCRLAYAMRTASKAIALIRAIKVPSRQALGIEVTLQNRTVGRFGCPSPRSRGPAVRVHFAMPPNPFLHEPSLLLEIRTYSPALRKAPKSRERSESLSSPIRARFYAFLLRSHSPVNTRPRAR